MHSFY